MNDCKQTSIANESIRSKTKIVVHINNYILPKSPSEEETSLRLSTPENSIAEIIWNSKSPKLKKVISPKSEFIILQAKSIKFPVKITPAYEIYPTTSLNEEKYDKKTKYANNLLKNTKFDINFKLPPISHSVIHNNFAKSNLTYPKLANKMTLPNYLKNQYNMHNANVQSLNQRSCLVRLKENNSSNALTNIILNKSDSQIHNKSKKFNYVSKSIITQEPSILVDSTGHKEYFENRIMRNEYTNPNSTFIEPSNYSFKLPYINKTFDADEYSVNLINQEINSKNRDKPNLIFNLSDQIDEEINKIIKNYPSIVVRRKGAAGEKKNNLKKIPFFLSENQIAYQIGLNGNDLNQIVTADKPKNDLTNNIDYGKLI